MHNSPSRRRSSAPHRLRSRCELQAVPYRRWPTGFFNHFPLPGFAEAGTQAADLQGWLTVENSELCRDRRRLTLTEWGVIVMQQRLIRSLTRFVAPTSALEEAVRPVLREAELERDWVEGLDCTASLEQRVADFSVFMGEADRVHACETGPRRTPCDERWPERSKLVRQAPARALHRKRTKPASASAYSGTWATSSRVLDPSAVWATTSIWRPCAPRCCSSACVAACAATRVPDGYISSSRARRSGWICSCDLALTAASRADDARRQPAAPAS